MMILFNIFSEVKFKLHFCFTPPCDVS